MKVQVSRLIEGCILVNDVLSASNRPLIHKNTIVTDHIIKVLNAFLIDEVEIEEIPKKGDLGGIKEIAESGVSSTASHENSNYTFYKQYIDTVDNYKRLFTSWQSGTRIDIAKVRKVILPLVQQILMNMDETFKLYHYCENEDYMYHHSVSVSLLSAVLAQKLGYKQGDINQIALTGLLCDSGMTRVDKNILSKKLTLTEKEYKEIKQHPIQSYQLLKNIMSIKEGVKIGVLQHHERIDGSGYPLGIKGNQLHPYSKIVALADTYQAMVSVRPYHSKQSPFKVLEQIMQDEFGKFDISIVNELKRSLLKFSTGTKVKLSNGLSAEIVFIDELHPTRPMIKVISENEIIALKDKRDIYIEELI